MPTSTLILLNERSSNFLQAAINLYISNLDLLKFFSVIISGAFIAGIVVLVIKTNWLGLKVERFRHIVLETQLSKEEAQHAWDNIETHFYKGDDNDLKVAIIEADKLLEEALREAGVRGISLGDRLKNIKSEQLANLDQVWQAHRLRNQIVHEPVFKIKRDLAEKALMIYEEALKNLGLLR